MMRRWERAGRRRAEMWEHLHKDDVAVGDHLAAMVHELKQVMFDYCRYAEKQRLTKPTTSDSGYDLINRWRAKSLNEPQNTAWKQIDEIRNGEVHVGPVDTLLKEKERVTFETEWGTIQSIEEEYVVTVEKEDGTSMDVPLLLFSRHAIDAIRKFIDEFDTIR